MTPKAATANARWQRLRVGASPPRAIVEPAMGRPIRDPKKAERWRGAFLGLIRQEHSPEELHALLDDGIRSRAWVMLRDSNGAAFRSFDRFCLSPQPEGLGTEPNVVRTLLDGLLGKRAATLALAPPSNQGRRPQDPTSHLGGERLGGHGQRTRAIAERAPEAVKKLSELGVLTYKEAAQFGPARPTAEQETRIAAFACRANEVLERLGESPAEEMVLAARTHLKQLLPRPSPQAMAEKLLRAYQRLPPLAKTSFLALLDGRRERAT